MAKDKKTAIYEAALSLIGEQRDISSIKIADIAQRADIGKGTVYEYFSSKEQVIAEAIIYMVEEGIRSLEGVIDEKCGFKESFVILLKHTEELMNKNMTFHQYMMTNECSFSLQKAHNCHVEKQFEEIRKLYVHLLIRIIDKGLGEGVIKKLPTVYDCYVAFSSSLMSILIYKNDFLKLDEVTEEMAMEKAYEVFVKLL